MHFFTALWTANNEHVCGLTYAQENVKYAHIHVPLCTYTWGTAGPVYIWRTRAGVKKEFSSASQLSKVRVRVHVSLITRPYHMLPAAWQWWGRRSRLMYTWVDGFPVDQLKGNIFHLQALMWFWCTVPINVSFQVKDVSFKLVKNPLVQSFWSQLRNTVYM